MSKKDKSETAELLKKELKDLPPDEAEKEVELNTQDEETVANILASFPSSGGYYGKLYQKMQLTGELTFRYFVDALENIPDVELYIANLVKQRNWPGGEFFLNIFNRDSQPPKTLHSIKVNIGTPEDNNVPAHAYSGGNGSGNNGENRFSDRLKEISETVVAFKAMLPNQGDNATHIANAFAQGVELAKAKDIGENKPTDMNQLLTLIATVMSFNKQGESKQSDLDTILKLRDAGLISLPREHKPEDPLESITKISEIMRAVQSFIPQAGASGIVAEAPSLGVELIRSIGPSIPSIVNSITGTINNLADVMRMKYTNSMSMQPRKVNLMEAPEKAHTQIEQETTMHPVVKKIHDSIARQDSTFFPELKNLIQVYVGKNILDQIHAGEIQRKDFLNTLSNTMGAPFLITSEADAYFNAFMTWYESTLVVAVCTNPECRAEYEFEDPNEIEKTRCDACATPLTLQESRT